VYDKFSLPFCEQLATVGSEVCDEQPNMSGLRGLVSTDIEQKTN
jgi:hypothetical protein